MEQIRQTFSQNLKIARKQSGLTVRQLAPLVGTTYVSISQWENGVLPQEKFIY